MTNDKLLCDCIYMEQYNNNIHKTITRWSQKHEDTLIVLHKYSNMLAQKYHDSYIEYKKTLYRYRIPIIIISTFTGFISIANAGYFPTAWMKYVSLAVGLSNLVVSIISTIENLKKINENMNLSFSAHDKFRLLSNSISVTLRIPRHQRDSDGHTYIKTIFAEFQQTLSNAPVLSSHHKNLLELDSLIDIEENSEDIEEVKEDNNEIKENNFNDDILKNLNKLFADMSQK